MANVTEDVATTVAQDLTGGEPEESDLQAQIRSLLDVVKAQQEQLNKLHTESDVRQGQPHGGSQTVKAPPIPAYCGNKDERSSVKVRGFVYNVRKVGALSCMNEAQMLALAECHLQANAAAWMMSMEKADTKPTTLDELQNMLIKEFVPSDERSRARMSLLTLQMRQKATEAHIACFQELVEMCSMPLSETYLFFFMSLSGKFKEEFTKKFPTGEPEDMQTVYDFARTIDRSIQWSKTTEKGSPNQSSGSTSSAPPRGTLVLYRGQKEGFNVHRSASTQKDENLLSWGPAKQGEKNMYRRNDRCFSCGGKGFKAGTCACKKNDKETPGPSGPNV